MGRQTESKAIDDLNWAEHRTQKTNDICVTCADKLSVHVDFRPNGTRLVLHGEKMNIFSSSLFEHISFFSAGCIQGFLAVHFFLFTFSHPKGFWPIILYFFRDLRASEKTTSEIDVSRASAHTLTKKWNETNCAFNLYFFFDHIDSQDSMTSWIRFYAPSSRLRANLTLLSVAMTESCRYCYFPL